MARLVDESPVRVATAVKPCRNCGAEAPGVYCPRCGQETAVALPTARQFLKDAAGRYVALDGRLWRTLAALLFHPGYLTREYLEGRRRRYIRPARLFLVLSIAMFALFGVMAPIPTISDVTMLKIDSNEGTDSASAGTPKSTGPRLEFDKDANLVFEGTPGGPIGDVVKRRVDRFNALPRDAKIEQLASGSVRYGPYAMVILLPAFALLLKLLYLGRSRRHPERPRLYAEHLVFAAHDLSFFFLIVMLAVVVPWGPMRAALFVWAIVYSLWAMKAVYRGRWFGVFARALVLATSYVMLFAIVVGGLLIAAVLLR
ncbi:MAG TPA: DUF3667 domain-containing protein [Casimicrobiaceae bacterium]|nr:DUF3667 domain-containing protein [Casimicrobiaceae bacterium]